MSKLPEQVFYNHNSDLNWKCFCKDFPDAFVRLYPDCKNIDEVFEFSSCEYSERCIKVPFKISSEHCILKKPQDDEDASGYFLV